MTDLTQTHSLTDFLKDHQSHLDRIHETKATEVLTINGEPQLVVMAPESYQALVSKAERQEFITGLREGLAAAQRGELKPAEQVHAEMRARYGLPG